jgi:perosamine synthetase
MNWKIPLFRMYWDEEDIRLVNEAIRSGMQWAAGPKIAEFEQGIADYIGSKYCLAFNSGTSALHAALAAYGIGKGDEVIVPSFTFIATANAPQFVGARPVFADIEEQTCGIDPDDVLEKITKNSRAIIPVHYGGCPCNITALRDIAEDHNLVLIEDAAEAFGAKIGDHKVGTFGDSGMFSFCQNKIITTGEGGAMVTDSRDLYEKMKLLRSHGRLETCDYFSTSAVMDYVSIGYNLRMSNITAALGIAQLNKVEKIIKIRRDDATRYIHNLNKIVPEIIIPEIPPGYFHVYQMFSVIAPDRDNLIKHLDSNSIMSKIYFSPVHLTDFYKNTLNYWCTLPVTEKIAGSIISLPFYPGIPSGDIDSVVGAIREFYGEN